MSRARPIVLILSLAVSGLAGPALAVDGVVEINQAAVAAGGITPGDTPGFPATLDRSGSYRLTSHLSLPSGTNGVEIATVDVTLDLNGFTIAGPMRIICPIEGCPPNAGIGVKGTTRNHVHNGMVRNMGGDGIQLGSNSSVERVTSTSNGGRGIRIGQSSRVDRCRALENGGAGISTLFYSIVTDNTANENGGEGIRAEATSSVRGNVIRDNGADGIFAPGSIIEKNNVVSSSGFGIRGVSSSTVIGNSLFFNAAGGISLTSSGYVHNVLASNGNLASAADEVTGGVSMGINVCDGAPCP